MTPPGTRAQAGDWLVVPLPPVERGWRWGRIVAQLHGPLGRAERLQAVPPEADGGQQRLPRARV